MHFLVVSLADLQLSFAIAEFFNLLDSLLLSQMYKYPSISNSTTSSTTMTHRSVVVAGAVNKNKQRPEFVIQIKPCLLLFVIIITLLLQKNPVTRSKAHFVHTFQLIKTPTTFSPPKSWTRAQWRQFQRSSLLIISVREDAFYKLTESWTLLLIIVPHSCGGTQKISPQQIDKHHHRHQKHRGGVGGKQGKRLDPSDWFLTRSHVHVIWLSL